MRKMLLIGAAALALLVAFAGPAFAAADTAAVAVEAAALA